MPLSFEHFLLVLFPLYSRLMCPWSQLGGMVSSWCILLMVFSRNFLVVSLASMNSSFGMPSSPIFCNRFFYLRVVKHFCFVFCQFSISLLNLFQPSSLWISMVLWRLGIWICWFLRSISWCCDQILVSRSFLVLLFYLLSLLPCSLLLLAWLGCSLLLTFRWHFSCLLWSTFLCQGLLRLPVTLCSPSIVGVVYRSYSVFGAFFGDGF